MAACHGHEGPSHLMETAEPRTARPKRGEDRGMDDGQLLQEVHEAREEAPRGIGPIVGRRPIPRCEGIALRSHVVPAAVVTKALSIDRRGEPIHGVRTEQTLQAQKEVAPEGPILVIGLAGESVRRHIHVGGDPPRL